MFGRPVMTLGHKRVIVNTTNCEFDSHSSKLNTLYFHFPRSGNRAKAWRKIPTLNTQYFQSSLESEQETKESKHYTHFLGSLCLPCYVRDTA